MKKRLLLPVLGLVVLALVAVAIWAFCSRGDDGRSAKQAQARLDACHTYRIGTVDGAADSALGSVVEAARDGMPSGRVGDYLERNVVQGLAQGEAAARAAAMTRGLTDDDFEVFRDLTSSFLALRRYFEEGDSFVLTRQWAPLADKAAAAYDDLCG